MNPWSLLKTSELLMIHATTVEHWKNVTMAREQMKERGIEPYWRAGKRYLALKSQSSVIEIAAPSDEQEARWEALCAEIDYRIPTPKDPRR